MFQKIYSSPHLQNTRSVQSNSRIPIVAIPTLAPTHHNIFHHAVCDLLIPEYKDMWVAMIGEELLQKPEPNNTEKDRYVVWGVKNLCWE